MPQSAQVRTSPVAKVDQGIEHLEELLRLVRPKREVGVGEALHGRRRASLQHRSTTTPGRLLRNKPK
jgi:hypothetical protein